MPQLSAIEQKFLLQLCQQDNNRLPLNQIYPNPKTPEAQCRAAAKRLQTEGLVEYDEQILQIAITPKGRLMFDMGMMARPVTPDELLVLKSCQYNKITLGQISRKVPEGMRRSLINALEDRKLVTTKRQIADVWLTDAGLAYLARCADIAG